MAQFEVLNSSERAVPVQCWSCFVAQNESTLFCSSCSKIQPPLRMDYFEVFRFPRKLEVDLDLLEKEFHRLSRKLHPDRFARSSDTEQQWSLADTAMINDAYRTLRDPIHRTEYLLKLVGEKIGEEHAGHNAESSEKRGSRVPADLLEEVFELNMQLDELREGDHKDPSLIAEVEASEKKFTAMVAEVDAQLKTEWVKWDSGDAEAQADAQKKMVALIDRRKYLDNLVRDVRKVLGE